MNVVGAIGQAAIAVVGEIGRMQILAKPGRRIRVIGLDRSVDRVHKRRRQRLVFRKLRLRFRRRRFGSGQEFVG